MCKPMKNWKKLAHSLLFSLLGSGAGLAYYTFVGCPTGTCPITSSAASTMVYTGLIGLLLSRVVREARDS